MPALIIILFVALFIVLAVFGHMQREKRKKALAAFAAARGLSFTPEKDRDMDERFAQFDCLRRGSSRYAYNRMTGEWHGRAMLAFDYHYATRSTDSTPWSAPTRTS